MLILVDYVWLFGYLIGDGRDGWVGGKILINFINV